MTPPDTTRIVTMTKRQSVYLSWTSDILIYTIVLNLFVEFAPSVIIESFTISILTAILLKVLLDVVMRFEHRVHHFFEQREGAFFRIAGTVSLIVILFLGKLLILEAVNFVFGDHVELGHFVQVLVLVLTLMITQRLFHSLYVWLGKPTQSE